MNIRFPLSHLFLLLYVRRKRNKKRDYREKIEMKSETGKAPLPFPISRIDPGLATFGLKLGKSMAQFKPGEGGRPAGSQNKLTRTVKETVLAVFNQMQEKPATSLLAWAETEPTEFYKIAAKLIPTEVKATVEQERVIIELHKAPLDGQGDTQAS